MASTILVFATVAFGQPAIATTVEGGYSEFSQQAGEYKPSLKMKNLVSKQQLKMNTHCQ